MALTPQQEKFYVYQLIDSRDGSVFYIGKGCGDRVSHHTKDAKLGRVSNVPKHIRILEIISNGGSVIESIVVNNVSSAMALQIERDMIIDSKHLLTNISHGCISNTESAIERAKHILKHIMPFKVWIAKSSKAQKEAAIKDAGSLDAFYNNSINFYKSIARVDL